MKCPVCPASELRMSDREGIEIDYCPTCRGVWLDRGELDQIIRRAAHDRVSSTPDATRHECRHDSHDERDRRLMNRHDEHRHPRRKKSFLNDIFDF